MPGKAPRRRPLLAHATSAPEALWAFLRGQSAYMRKAGLDVTVVSSPGALLDEVGEREGVSVFGIPMTRAVTPFRDLVALWRLWRLFRRLRPDIVHVHTPKAGLLGAVAAYLARVPVRIYDLWGLRLEGARWPLRSVLLWSERLVCALCQRITCNSDSLRKKAVSLGIVAEGKTELFASSNGVEVARFASSPERREEGRRLRAELGIAAEAKVIGFVGRVVRDKGIEELVSAFSKLGAEREDLHLLLVGPFEKGDEIAAATRRGIEANPRIASTGFVTDPQKYYHAMDVFVLPTYREGFPNTCLEAACAELPVVTTTATGAVDSVVDGETGLLVPARDPEALKVAIEKLLDDADRRRRMGRKGRERAERDFKPEVIWEALLDLYSTMLRARGSDLPRRDT